MQIVRSAPPHPVQDDYVFDSDTVGQGLPLAFIDVFAVDTKGFTPDDGAIWVAVDSPVLPRM